MKFWIDYPIKSLGDILYQIAPEGLKDAKDKRDWVSKYLSPSIQVICSSGWKDKVTYCNLGDILVDDSERNIRDWFNSGGVGILHRPHKVESTLYDLKYIGAIK